MADEVNFLDLVALSRITPDLVVEKFGGKINSSFFDGSNILGSLRLKNLVDFTATFPVQSAITVTETGKLLLQDAAEKAKTPFDQVDLAIITQLQSGKRTYMDLGGAVNLRPKDLAMRLYKLGEQQYIVYEIKNGNVDIMLTEKGLMQAKQGMPKPQQQANAQATQTTQDPLPQQQEQELMPPPQEQMLPEGTPMASAPPEQSEVQRAKTLEEIEAQIKAAKRRNMMFGIAGVIIVVILIILLFVAKVI